MMRFFIASLFALSLFVGGMNAYVPIVHAVGKCPGDQIEDELDGCVPPPAASASAQTPVPANTAGDDKPVPVTLGDNGYGAIMTWIMKFFAYLLGIAAVSLDAAVYYTVLTMGKYIHELSAIGITWGIIRDIGNIALIFGFLLAGINIILGTHFYGEGNKLIPTLIIVAVSLNFSLFVAEAVIDTGNLFASQIYTAINKGDAAGVRDVTWFSFTETGSQGVAGIIMAQLGLQTIYGDAVTNKTLFNENTSWSVALMSILLFMITAFVMFSLALMLVARFVILVLVIITSPIGFFGYAIPPLEDKAKLWWHTLINQSLTAPVLMLMLYVALSVITDKNFFGFDATAAGWSKMFTDPVSGGGVLLTFLVAMGLLLAVNMFAKELSAFGAKWATGMAGKAAFGIPSWVARRTIGKGANALGKYVSGTKIGRIPLVGTGAVKALHGIAHSSFDLRGVGAVSGIAGAGIEGKDAQHGGYLEDVKQGIKAREEYAKSLHGHELDEAGKIRQMELQNRIKKIKEDLGNAAPGDVAGLARDLKRAEDNLAKFEISNSTDAGVRLAYAQTLNKDFTSLGLGQWANLTGGNGKFAKFVKFVNSEANEEAAKKIIKDVKQSPDEKAIAAAIAKMAGGGGAPSGATTAGGGSTSGSGGASGGGSHGASAGGGGHAPSGGSAAHP